jgi:hypothetical protein
MCLVWGGGFYGGENNLVEVFFDHSVVVFGGSGVCWLGCELIEHVICEN